MTNFLLSVAAALFYSVASARLYVSLGRARPSFPTAGAGGAGDSFAPTPPSRPSGLSPAARVTPRRPPGVVPDGDAGLAPGRPDSRSTRRRLTLALAAAGLALHAWVALSMTGLPDTLQLPFFTALAVTAIGVVLLQLVLCVRQPADYLGLAVYPLAAVALLAGQASGEGGTVQGHAVQVHVLLSVLAYAVLSLTAAQAGLVAIQRHFLSRHRPGGFMRALPPLDTTERLLFALLTAGFALLTLSLASGFLYLEDMFAQHLVHKSILACIAWAIFGVLLYGRWRFGWRGRRAVHWTLAGFGVLILAYFGSKFVLELVLAQG